VSTPLTVTTLNSVQTPKVLDWRLYILIPGGMSWYGLIRAALHPALALAFVVPFMPTGDVAHDEHENGDKKEIQDIEMVSSFPIVSVVWRCLLLLHM
jgi:hypothetical protein